MAGYHWEEGYKEYRKLPHIAVMLRGPMY